MTNTKEPETKTIYHPSPLDFTEQVGKEYCVVENYVDPDGMVFDTKSHIVKNNGAVDYLPLNLIPWPENYIPVKANFNDIYSEIKSFIYEHNDLLDERQYDIVALWIMASWITEHWNSVPYLKMLGPKNSGKTRLMDSLRLLCYRGCKSSDVSESALYRVVEQFHITVLLDESEIYSTSAKDGVQGLLNAGYRRGDYVIRVKDPKTNELSFFDTFGFKAIAGTEALKDTLESRCISIIMSKNVRRVKFRMDESWASKIRATLLYWRFYMLATFRKEVVTSQELGDELSFCDGRFAELYHPIVETSKLVSKYAK